MSCCLMHMLPLVLSEFASQRNFGKSWLSLFLGSALVFCGHAQAGEQAGRRLDVDNGLDTLLVLAEEQRIQMARIESYSVAYTIEVVDNAYGEPNQIRTSKGSVQEIRSGEKFFSSSTWKDTYSNKKPEKALADYQRFVIVSDKELIFWIAGQRFMSLWNLTDGLPLDSEADAHLRASQVPFVERLYGDGNMVLSDLLKFVESFPNWSLEVYENLSSTGATSSYTVQIIDSERPFPLYRKFDIVPDRGYTCSRITTFNPDGSLVSEIENSVTEQSPGSWWLTKTTFREFAPALKNETDASELKPDQDTSAIVVAEVNFSMFDPHYSPSDTDFSLSATRAPEGQRITLKNGRKGEHILWRGEAVDRETYEQLTSQLEN